MMKKIKMHIMANGVLGCDNANLIAMPKLANSENMRTVSDWISCPVYTVLLEHPDALILFDTACHPDAMKDRWDKGNMLRTPYTVREEELLPNTLRQLGYGPDDVTHVVLSHLHEDHAGCLEMFTKARIYVNDEELMKTLRLYALNGDMGGYIRNDIKAWLEAPLHWMPVEAEVETMELVEGVTILNFGPGHTFGMMGLLVSLIRSGDFILASDAINTARNLGPPILYPGLAYDTRGYHRTVVGIARLAERRRAKIIFGHDIEQFNKLMGSTGGHYE